MILTQTFLLALFLSVAWGVYLVFTIRDLLSIQHLAKTTKRDRIEIIATFRRMIVAVCVFMLPFSLLIRTAIVGLGFGDQVAGQVVFFALAGSNIPGAVFAALTVTRPKWFD